jgi:branched-chain amino acid transport system substrate-binding protein
MHPPQEIVAGLSISQTGSFARQGRQALDGIRLWQSYINAQGGLALGSGEKRPVRLVCYDDQSRTPLAQQNVLRLLREDYVDLLLGPYSSGLTLAVAPLAQEHKKILWNHGGSSDEISGRGYRYVVNAPGPASDYLRELPRWLAKHAPKLRRVCILHSSRGTFASQVARGFAEAISTVGVHSLDVAPMDLPRVDAETVVQKLHALRPEVAVLAGRFEDEVRLLRSRHLWPNTVQQVIAVAAGVNAFFQELNQGAEGVIGPSQWEPGAHFRQILGQDANWFVSNFQEWFGQLPDYTAAGGFAIGLLLSECVCRAGSLEDERLRAVAAELDFNTFYGRFRLDPATGRQIGHLMLLTQWQQGRKVVLREDESLDA